MRTHATSASSIEKIESPRAGRQNLPEAAASPGALERRASKELLMVFRYARRIRVAAAFIALASAFIISFALLHPAHAQTGAPKPQGQPAVPTPPEGIQTKPGDAFGQEVTLTAKPIVYVKGTGAWDSAFATISSALKKVEAYADKAGLKADGQPMTIFTATDDHGFDYQAAIPLAQPPKDPPKGDIAAGQSPEGRALEFVHRGSYEAMDDTYEAITNYLDEKRLESKDLLIEQYVTDPASSDEKNLIVNVFVPIK
jgi:effector-binding domain-containing protein